MRFSSYTIAFIYKIESKSSRKKNRIQKRTEENVILLGGEKKNMYEASSTVQSKNKILLRTLAWIST
jgi:hypothetical protein